MKSLYSVTPPTKYLTFAVWIYLVPQYRPQNVLVLGYAGGTVAGLIRLLYGDVTITAVDVEPCEASYGVEFVQADATEFMRDNAERRWDAIVVDLFVENEPVTITEEMAGLLERCGNYIIVNTMSSVRPPLKFPIVHAQQVGANYVHYFQRPGHDVELTPPV